MEKIKTVIDEKVVKELMQNYLVLSLVSISIGLLMVALYVVLGILNGNWTDILSIILVVLGVLSVFLGSILLVSYLKSIKRAKGFLRTAVYDLREDAISYELFRNEEKIEEGKQYYQDLLDYKETDSFVFVRLQNNTFLAIDKVDGLIDFLISKGIPKFKTVRANRKHG